MTISIKHLTTTALISVVVMSLAGCSGFVAPPKGSPTMAEVYKAGNDGQDTFYNADDQSASPSAAIGTQNAALPTMGNLSASNIQGSDFVNTLNSQFPTVPNPQSLMYIFGHYAGADEMPVPGHFIAFPLYDKTYYALPGEVMMPYNDGQFTR